MKSLLTVILALLAVNGFSQRVKTWEDWGGKEAKRPLEYLLKECYPATNWTITNVCQFGRTSDEEKQRMSDAVGPEKFRPDVVAWKNTSALKSIEADQVKPGYHKRICRTANNFRLLYVVLKSKRLITTVLRDEFSLQELVWMQEACALDGWFGTYIDPIQRVMLEKLATIEMRESKAVTSAAFKDGLPKTQAVIDAIYSGTNYSAALAAFGLELTQPEKLYQTNCDYTVSVFMEGKLPKDWDNAWWVTPNQSGLLCAPSVMNRVRFSRGINGFNKFLAEYVAKNGKDENYKWGIECDGLKCDKSFIKPTVAGLLQAMNKKDEVSDFSAPLAVLASTKLKTAWDSALTATNQSLVPKVAVITNTMRMYCEAVVPASKEEGDRQIAAVTKAVEAGCDTILLAYYGTGTGNDVKKVIDDIHEAKAKVLLTFACGENDESLLNASIDMDAVKDVLSKCMASIDYYLPTWRGFSRQHGLVNKASFQPVLEKMLLQLALAERSDVPVFGMVEKGTDGANLKGASVVIKAMPVRSYMELRSDVEKFAVPVMYGPVCFPDMYKPQDDVKVFKLMEIGAAEKISTFRMSGDGDDKSDWLTRVPMK